MTPVRVLILDRLAAAIRRGGPPAVLVCLQLVCLQFAVPLSAQAPYIGYSLSDWPPAPSQASSTSRGDLVSADLLRHPVSSKARAMLFKALQTAEAGDHLSAIEQLKAVLAKYPTSAAHVHTILGVEYVRTDQYPAAVDSLAQAVQLLPHNASNHANFGLALMAVGRAGQAKQELRRALELNPKLPQTRELLDTLLVTAKSKDPISRDSHSRDPGR